MKKVEAYIKQSRLVEVVERLHAVDGLTGMSVLEMRGFGRTRRSTGPVHIVDNSANWVPHVKIEAVCLDDLVETVVDAVCGGAHTGLRADGKVYVYAVEDAVRISTGERGAAAV